MPEVEADSRPGLGHRRSRALLLGGVALSLAASGTLVAGAGAHAAPAARTAAEDVAVANTTTATATAAAEGRKRRERYAIRHVKSVPSNSFGIHSFQGRPGVNAGSFRLPCAPTWRKMNPARGTYDWSAMEQRLDHIEGYGYRDIMFTFCGTPDWAAEKPLPRPDVIPYFGTWGSAAPARMAYWQEFVTAFVAKFRSRIDSYETWNEATSLYQWQGTGREMAQMTAILKRVVDRLDPSAVVLSANLQTVEQPDQFARFFPPYAKSLKALKWPIDALAIHTYAGAVTDRNLADSVLKREQTIRKVLTSFRTAGVPSRVKTWDTETNFLRRSPTKVQQGVLGRIFLDSWRFGIRRTYWYLWTTRRDPWLGIQLLPGAPSVAAFDRIVGWTAGARLTSCTTSGRVNRCAFRRGGRTFTIAYSTGLKTRATVRFKGTTQTCLITTSTCRKAKRQATVGFLPVRIGRPVRVGR